MSSRWLILTATLPTSPSGLRVRVWRSLKATGAGTLREGVYVLPEHAATAPVLRELERTIAEAGADAHLLEVPARDAAQARTFEALFDRGEAHAEFQQQVKDARAQVRKATESGLRRMLRELESRLHALRQVDFFPAAAARRSDDALAALRREAERRLSPGEPAPSVEEVPALDRADYQGRTWATRRRPWIDRLATAWLVARFVDRAPTFKWLADPSRCPRRALGYDFDGAAFTHVGDKVTFEVVAESFGLLADPALARLARLVHVMDVGGEPADEAPGVELLVRGLQARHPDDDALLAAALPVFDALLAALQVTE